jgi:hypothetical protein
MSITRAQIATQLLNEMAPKGEKLAYINNREAELLKRMGGAGKNINETGIKSYYYDEVGQTMGGTGFQDTSHLTGGSGDGNNQPPTEIINQKAIDNYKFGPSRFEEKALKTALFLSPVGIAEKVLSNKYLNDYYNNERKIAEDVTTPRNTGYGQAIGSQYFGPVNNAMMQSYKNVVGGFPNTDPFVNTGGGDNQIIPRMQMIAEAPSDVESTPSDFDLYAALEGREGMRFGENPYDIRGVTQRFAGGGEVRQAYGLGKLVKKATRAVKKVLKSDIGKAALLYAGGTYLGGMEAFGGAGISKGTSFGFQNFGKRLFNPTGTDGITNLLNPFRSTGGGFKLPFVQTEQEQSAKLAKELGLIEKSALSDSGKEKLKDSLITKSLNIGKSEIPGYVKYGIPAAMLATYGAAKKEEPDDLDQEIAQNYTDNSGLKELIATYKPFRFEVQKPYQLAAYGGRIGYEIGGDIDPADLPMSREGFPRYEDESGEEVPYPYNNQEMASNPDPMAELFQMYLDAIGSGKIPRSTTFEQFKELMSSSSINESMGDMSLRENANLGGIMGYAYGPQNYRQMAAEGGRINFSNGGGPTKYIKDVLTKKGYQDMMQNMNDDEIRSLYDSVMGTFSRRFAEGGMIDLGGMEKDYRAEGGFVPIGGKEKADDVPARLSKNEFVFTADAVRNAGGGDVDKGAEVMYNVMKNLESGGKISEKSQGLQGARNMFQTSQKLGEIL